MLVALSAFNYLAFSAALAWLLALWHVGAAIAAVSILFALPVASGMAIHLARLLLHYALRPLPNDANLQPIADPAPLVVPVIIRRESDIDTIYRCARTNLPFVARLPMVFLIDLPDADRETKPGDAVLLDLLRRRLQPDVAAGRILLLTRGRRHDPVDRVWRGWERKRGKLEEFCRLVQGSDATSFEQPLPETLRGTTAFVTIDIDTRLLPETIVSLMRSADHDAAIVTPMLEDACRPEASWFERLQEAGACRLSFNPHLNFNQSRLGYDLFYGKGLIVVARFLARTEGRIAERTILSHDHLESILAGAVASSRAVVREDVPASRGHWAQRQYRWMRGDFQIVPWIVWSDLPIASRLHLLELVLNHLIPTCCLALAAVSLAALPWPPSLFVSVACLLLARPALVLAPLSLPIILLEPNVATAERWSRMRSVIASESAAWALSFVYAPSNGLMVLRAASVVAWRRGWSGRNLLQWEDSAQAKTHSVIARSHAASAIGAAASAVALAATYGPMRAVAASTLAWCILPLLLCIRRLRRPIAANIETLDYESAMRGLG